MKKINIIVVLFLLIFFFTSCNKNTYNFGPISRGNYKTQEYKFEGKKYHYISAEEMGMFSFTGIDDMVGMVKLKNIKPYYKELYANDAENPEILWFGDSVCGGYYLADSFAFPDLLSLRFYKYIKRDDNYPTPQIEETITKNEFVFQEMFDCDHAETINTIKTDYEFKGKIFLFSKDSKYCFVELSVFKTKNDRWFFRDPYNKESACYQLNYEFADIVKWYFDK